MEFSIALLAHTKRHYKKHHGEGPGHALEGCGPPCHRGLSHLWEVPQGFAFRKSSLFWANLLGLFLVGLRLMGLFIILSALAPKGWEHRIYLPANWQELVRFYLWPSFYFLTLIFPPPRFLHLFCSFSYCNYSWNKLVSTYLGIKWNITYV